jgi:rfaE bifunctional protein nucleotidyltransferase chain/domain
MPLIALEDLARRMALLREERKRIVFTNGCFDVIHPGHVALLEKAASLGDVLVVAVNDDESVRRLKGEERPIMPASERAEILLAMRWVDYVTVFPDDTPGAVIELVRPDVLAKGAEYEKGDIVGAEFVEGYGGEVVRIDMKPGYSSRNIISRIRAGKSARDADR